MADILKLFPEFKGSISISVIAGLWDLMNTDCCQAEILKAPEQHGISLSDFEALSVRESAIIDRFVKQWKDSNRIGSPTASSELIRAALYATRKNTFRSDSESMLYSVQSYRSCDEFDELEPTTRKTSARRRLPEKAYAWLNITNKSQGKSLIP